MIDEEKRQKDARDALYSRFKAFSCNVGFIVALVASMIAAAVVLFCVVYNVAQGYPVQSQFFLLLVRDYVGLPIRQRIEGFFVQGCLLQEDVHIEL